MRALPGAGVGKGELKEKAALVAVVVFVAEGIGLSSSRAAGFVLLLFEAS
jgi:hypothetical protein